MSNYSDMIIHQIIQGLAYLKWFVTLGCVTDEKETIPRLFHSEVTFDIGSERGCLETSAQPLLGVEPLLGSRDIYSYGIVS